MIHRLAIAAALFVLVAAAPPVGEPSSRVTGLRLESSAGQTELLIQVDGGPVRWAEFTLPDPPRLIIDLVGARSDIPGGEYEQPNRGGIVRVRATQFSADIVRLVIDLDHDRAYSIGYAPGGIRISLAGAAQPFEPWSTPSSAVRSPAPLPAAEQPSGVQQVQQQARRITVTFQEADIRDVLATFAEFTGRSIVPGAGVTGTVTAEIRNQPWDIALRTILEAHGLAARELPTGIIRVDALDRLREREVQDPLVTQTYRINYVPVQELVATLTPLRTERGSVLANPSTNTLIVTDVEGVVNNIGAMVRQLDVRTPQVAIQAKIIFVNRTQVQELGVTYDLKDSRGSQLNRLVQGRRPTDPPGEFTSQDLILLGGNSIAALGNANARVTGAALETVISLVLGRHTLITFIDALQTAELSDVQAAPLITTLDNQEAEIWVGERTPIRVVDVGTPGVGGADVPGGGAPRATAQLVETGIRLRVTPHITGDRRILMQLHAERSAAQLAATDIGVIFQTQQGSTRLLVADGETAVIGGLTVSEVASTRAGIPVLMDIPYLGALFRTTRNREQKRDLLILVTPHIVDDRG